MNKNYTLVDRRELDHIKAKGYLYNHVSGAKVLYLKSDDNNKVFSAAFKTPPIDETGIAHIMEHAVLNGSQKYPLKDPFNQLMNGSLYTFLNAMTYPDRTIYPVASINDKDFLNLMDVYLDAVFFPKVYDRKESLWQEGWHYQLEDEQGPLKYNGIVYNEMKGAYSDPYSLLGETVFKALFPDTPYSLSSGGNPEFIPDLDYDYFIDFHKKHYCPENALIFFYGNMDIEYCFDKLDKEYLSKFDKQDINISIKPQAALSAPVFTKGQYSVADEKDLDENYMGATFVLPHNMPQEEITAMRLLSYILMSTPASPLYKALVEAEAGEDISGYFGAEIIHPSFRINMKNAKITAEEFKEMIDNNLENIVKEGLNPGFVQACLNFSEFQAKEEDYGPHAPKGLMYNLRAMSTWIYGENSPFDGLMGITHLPELRKNCEKGGYLEGLIRKYLLDNAHKGYVTLNPVLDLDGQKEKAVEEKLAKIKEGFDKDEINKIIANNKALKKYQETPESQEMLNLIPRLAVSDIKTSIETVEINAQKEKGLNVLHSPLSTNDIIYTTMLFDMSSVPQKHLPLVKILQYILSKVPTRKYSTGRLTEEIKANLGGLSFASDILSKTQKDFMPRALVSAKFLSKNTGIMFDLVSEIVKNTVFTDKSQLKNYVLELKASMEDMFLTSGISFAAERSATYFSPSAAYSDNLGGLAFYEYVKSLSDSFDSRFEQLGSDLADVSAAIYSKNNVQYSLVCDDELYGKYLGHLHNFHDSLFETPAAVPNNIPLITPKNEGFITASKVQYCAMSADIFADGHAYNGGLKVLSNILDNYLYEGIRVKGGAYGCGSTFSQNGSVVFWSYRDPHVANTYDIYRKTAEYAKTLDISKNEMDKFILGTIRDLDRPLSNAHKGFRATTNYILGITDEDRQNERDSVLSADVSSMQKLSAVLEDAIAQNNICAIGGEAGIEAAADLFGSIKKI